MHFDFLRSMAVTKETGRQSLPPRKKNFKVHANLIDLAGKKFSIAFQRFGSRQNKDWLIKAVSRI
ncbi:MULTISPECIES: hypothetical protein [unclassified Rhizobium]|uniref:hypothetical protein n=1 Tax=unclassified Rhizobium TaxID=2613769 RepID=UPI0007EA99A3|nr:MULTISPECIES: hypothetical protein [unclassified Rhizobium]ANM13773.1 hypothetical protein AMK05_PC00258 [Rhizobium sp. N324]ANM20155.1 hypothetical protein AMK06_PC100244 [Rhizobium sp. N541]ANM26540.1 hypothetical protein AMK07_PC100244 [Rhizobium sp. N941]OYD00808.1 hypothetical protein AMK08_PC00260 [Rhizobium sp. N4311]